VSGTTPGRATPGAAPSGLGREARARPEPSPIIDWHAHIYPPKAAARPEWRGDPRLVIEKLLDAHAEADIDLCVVTNPIHYLKEVDNAATLDELKRWNDYAAEVQRAYADRVIVFACAIPGGGDAFLHLVERDIREYGLRGVFIDSSHCSNPQNGGASRQ
jgi:predicted TIM-barrel fold metal-dependent hydrolase